ncbi:HTH-type transcriptional regulator BhcR [Neptunicoccus sediminis]|uniref:HTH-type transcriptional regulator BhcR n=1 Tax=Neptunicoccus sediminis TaxID=1892596 RepID=UPI000845BE91|nr:HTH-type transcriptional regulator BhcR [Neptunicoccus sediminis]
MAFQDNDNPAERKPRGRPRAFHPKTEQNTIKSLDRAMVVLGTVASNDGVSLSALSQRLGESPATLYRVLTTLAQHQIVETNESTQTWHIGAGAFLIGSAFLRRTSLVETSRPILRELMETTGETANLGVEKDGHVLFLGQVETHAPIRAFFPPGTLSPLHASGIGKVLLAYFDTARLNRFASAGLERFTDQTLGSKQALEADLEQVRSRGYSVDDQERNIGMRCIAAPIRNALGEVIAGISVSGPTSRIDQTQIPALAEAVIAAASRVSHAMGAGLDRPYTD